MLLYSLFTMTYGNNSWLKVVSLAILFFTLLSCGTGKSTLSSSKTSTSLQDDIIQYGKQYLGKPYRHAGKGPNGFDCSGYTSFVFRKFGYRLESSSAGQERQTPTISRKEELRKGDLVFFEGNRKNGNVGHVGIVTETFSNGRFTFIHSSTTRGVIISSSTEPYYASRYLRGGRVLEENASYVTRRKPSTDTRHFSTTNKEVAQPIIFEATLSGREEIRMTGREEENQPGKEVVILVQADPQKNAPLASTTNREKEENNLSPRVKSDMALREEENITPPSQATNHKIQMGETLFSISRKYGCTVDQLKSWNPQLKSVLNPGEALLIYTD